MSDRREPLTMRLWHPLAALLIFLLAYAATGWRLAESLDVFTDEILYTRAGIRVDGEGALVWDSGKPIYVHPPLYFLAEAAYWRLTNAPASPLYEAGDVFAQVYHARTLNALLAGMTAAVLYLLGRKLGGIELGLLLAALFMLDPFGLRINRRAMLETLAALLTLSGMGIVLLARGRTSRRASLSRAVLAGLLLGGALLVKELTFTSLVVVLLLGLWDLWHSRRAHDSRIVQAGSGAGTEAGQFGPAQSLLTLLVALLTYGLYPVWMLVSGNWSGFVQVKLLSLQRLLGLVHLSGWNRPGVSLADFLAQRLGDYGTSYALLTLGGAATLWLLYAHRRRWAGRVLGTWGLVLYPFFGFVALFGSGNDQFFYFLLLTALLLVGYTASAWWIGAVGARARHMRILAAAFLLVLFLPYNLARWWSAYGAGVDNGYYKVTGYVKENIPAGEALNATGDAIKFQYVLPDHAITTAATPDEAQALGIHYFALSPKDVQARYGRMTPELAGWITSQGQLLYSVEGDSYGQISLYRVDYGPGPTVVPDTHEAEARQRSFGPARSGFVGGLLLALGLWTVLVGGLAAWLRGRSFLMPFQGLLHRHPAGTKPFLEAERERA